MKIEHVAIWTTHLEAMRRFYGEFFEAKSSEKYRNPQTGFESYFLTFESGARLELMSLPELAAQGDDAKIPVTGLTHIAFSVGSRERVDWLTAALGQHGYRVVGAPRQTGDGYYESSVLDPDGNIIEITA